MANLSLTRQLCLREVEGLTQDCTARKHGPAFKSKFDTSAYQKQQGWHLGLERSWVGHEVMLGTQGGTSEEKSEVPHYRAGNGNLARPRAPGQALNAAGLSCGAAWAIPTVCADSGTALAFSWKTAAMMRVRSSGRRR